MHESIEARAQQISRHLQALRILKLNYDGFAQEGLANVCLVGSSVTVVKAKIEANLPRKRGAAMAGYDKAITSFNEKVSKFPSRAR